MTTDTGPRTTTTATAAMTQGRRADSARRRQRVLTALSAAINSGEQMSVIRYRPRRRGGPHLPLPPPRTARTDPRRRSPTTGHHPRRRAGGQPRLPAGRPARRPTTRHPHGRPRPAPRNPPIHLLGEHAWRESGLGAPDDIDQLKQQIVTLEQHVVDLRLQLEERDQDLATRRQPRTHGPNQHQIPQQVNIHKPACTTPVALDTVSASASELRKRSETHLHRRADSQRMSASGDDDAGLLPRR